MVQYLQLYSGGYLELYDPIPGMSTDPSKIDLWYLYPKVVFHDIQLLILKPTNPVRIRITELNR